MMRDKEGLQSDFVQSLLPWLIAAGSLLIYLLTLNHWVSISSLPITAKITGWDWKPTIPAPILYVATYPFRFLSTGLQPLALNFFSAVCAALTLALLARSVTLLPHDRTREQRQRERSEFSLLSTPLAWLPPVLAVLMCGFQLTFWEHATAITDESVNLLMFAYVIRCLLEYRVDQRESWLYRMAFVYGLAVTNNWAMIGFFPAFLVALIWIKGFSFFDFRFLAAMIGLGLLGLLFYLLIPLVEISSGSASMNFLELLKQQLAAQKNILLFGPLRNRALVCGLTSILPVLVMGIRWPSTFGDLSPAGAALTNFMFKLIHGMFLVACLWVAFDKVSPRRLGLGLPFLTFYYLGALSIGYFSGYFLLVFGEDPKKSWGKSSSSLRLVNRLVIAILLLAFVAVPAALAFKNLPIIREDNSGLLKDLPRLSVQALPEKGSVVLSEDGTTLLLLEALLSNNEDRQKHLLVNTQLLPFNAYHSAMSKRYGGRWPSLPSKDLPEPIDPLLLLGFVNLLTLSNQVYYLHPSFGYYFEYFYLQPKGLVYEFKPYPVGTIMPPPLTQAVVEENQSFWSKMKDDFTRLARPNRRDVPDAELLGRHYSRALNYWGVQLQRENRLEEAHSSFEWAQKLNIENVSAVVNARFNESLRSGRIATVKIEKSVEDQLEKYPDWAAFVQACGPVDEPGFCQRLAEVFEKGNLYRQAAQQLIRASALRPDDLALRFQLANVYHKGQRPDKMLEIVREIRERNDARNLTLADQIELVRLEAWAYYNPTNLQTSEKLLLDAQQKHPEFEQLLLNLSEMYLRAERYKEAIETLDKQLALTPDNLTCLLNKGAIYIKLKSYDKAIPVLSQVLAKDPKNIGAMMNRGIANFHLGNLNEAEQDYKALEKQIPHYPWAYYRLAEIAGQRKNRADEISNYKLFLKYAPAGAEEIKEVREQLKRLRATG